LNQATLQRASLVASHMRDNKPFTPGAGPNGGDFFLPWRQLREHFLSHGIELNTPDRNAGHEVLFELHLNAQRSIPAQTPRFAYLYRRPHRPPAQRPTASGWRNTVACSRAMRT